MTFKFQQTQKPNPKNPKRRRKRREGELKNPSEGEKQRERARNVLCCPTTGACGRRNRSPYYLKYRPSRSLIISKRAKLHFHCYFRTKLPSKTLSLSLSFSYIYLPSLASLSSFENSANSELPQLEKTGSWTQPELTHNQNLKSKPKTKDTQKKEREDKGIYSYKLVVHIIYICWCVFELIGFAA